MHGCWVVVHAQRWRGALPPLVLRVLLLDSALQLQRQFEVLPRHVQRQPEVLPRQVLQQVATTGAALLLLLVQHI